MQHLKIYKDVDEVIESLAKVICDSAEESIKNRGVFNFVLAGGGSPKKLSELLASDAYKNKIDWRNTYFFFGDERFVPENDEERNSLMVKKALLDPLNIQKSHIFNVDTTTTPGEAAMKYWEVIKSHFKDGPILFD